MTTTVRLLATYDGSPPQTIRGLPDALATSFVAQGNASLDLTGGVRRYQQGPTLSTVLTQALRGTATIKENEQTTLYLPEGAILNVSSNGQVDGDIQVKDSAGNLAQALPLAPGVFGVIGPYPGVCQVVASCKSGEVQLTASVNLAGAARQVSGVPQGVTWAGVSPTPAIDFYVLGFSAQPTIFLDPSASTSKNRGTLNDPFTSQAQVQLACRGDMSGQVLGIKRGTTLRVTGVDGLVFDCYGTPAKPFIVCPYGDAVALPIITAGVVRRDWMQHSGGIYKITGVAQNTDVFQGDRRLWKKTSLAGITGEGMSFYDSGTSTLYAWAYGSIDPNASSMEIQGSDYAINVRYSNVPQTGNVHVIGMDCRKARNIPLRISRPTVFAAMTAVSGLRFIGCRAGQAGYDAVGLTNAADAVLLYGASDTVRAADSLIIGCEGFDSLNNSFEVANVDGLIVDGNYGHDAGGNTILEAWSSCSNMKVRNNYGLRSGNTGRIFTNYHNGGIWATTYNDVAGGTNQSHAAFQNNLYEFNIIAESQGQSIQIDGGNGNKVHHNTLYNSTGTPTNRMLNLFANCSTPGAADADVSNNLLMCGSSGNRVMVDIVQGTVASTDTGAVALTATVTGNNNAYLAWAAPTAQLRVRTAAGVTLNGQSGLAAYKTAATPFDSSATSNWTTPGALISPEYRPLGAMLTGGKTGMSARRYKDGFAYDPASCAVGAFGS
jgi:hypothetical protein